MNSENKESNQGGVTTLISAEYANEWADEKATYGKELGAFLHDYAVNGDPKNRYDQFEEHQSNA